MAGSDANAQRDGRRVLVLWILWLTLFALLIAAGVTLLVDGAPPPATGAVQPAGPPGPALAPQERTAALPDVLPRAPSGPGERRAVELAVGNEAAMLRLGGLPAALLPFCELLVAKVEPSGREQKVWTGPLDANGRASCPGVPGTQMRARIVGLDGDVLCATVDGAFDFLLEAGEVEVRPTQAVLGLQVVDRGHAVPACLDLHKPIDGGPRRQCFLVAAAVFDATTDIFGVASGHGPFRVDAASGLRAGDFVQIDPRSGIRYASLCAAVSGVEQPHVLGLRLLSLQDGAATTCRGRREHGCDEFTAIVPAGDYRLEWTVGAGPGPVALPLLGLAPGEDRQLELVPPALARWELVVDDWQDLVAMRLGPALVRIDRAWALGGIADGRVPSDVVNAPTAASSVELCWPALRYSLAAQVVAVDAAATVVRVRSGLGPADVVSATAVAAFGGKAAIWLANPEFPVQRNPAWLGGSMAIPLRAGERRDGCVIEERSGEGRKVTRWFTVTHGEREVRLEPRGRWVAVRIDRPIAMAVVRVEGPAAMDPIEVATLRRPGTTEVFVADGTRKVHVDCEPGGRQSFEPALGEFVVR